jgi:hypothetical protein
MLYLKFKHIASNINTLWQHCLLFSVFIISMSIPYLSQAASWEPVKDISLMIEPESILDFSSVVEYPKIDDSTRVISVGGYLALSNDAQTPRRFFMASLGFAPATGSFPSHSVADMYARQLRMHGYNMARLDFVEDSLMDKRIGDFDFNPEQLDRFRYLLFALKREGIYYVLNGLSSGNGAYGNVNERWIDKYRMKLGVYYDSRKQLHWKQMIEKMYGGVNPYTGMTTLADPALAGLIMVNEGGLEFITRAGVPDEFRPLFAEWLKQKYRTTSVLSTAWKGELKAGESLDYATVNFPRPGEWTSLRMADAQEFFVALEKSTAEWMTKYIRQLGYKGLLTAYNNWLSPAASVARGQLDWVDMHNYFAEPTNFVAAGSVMRQDSMLAGGTQYVRELAVNRHIGKPYTVSEFGSIFWNQYRRESGLAVPAYASFQGWGMICQHAGAIDLSYAGSGGRKDAIYPFVIGMDPVARAGETLASLLFLRGDVSKSNQIIGIKLSPKFVFGDNPFLGNMPEDISRLGLVTGVGVDWLAQSEGRSLYQYQVEPDATGLKVLNPAATIVSGQGSPVLSKVDDLARKYAGKLAPQVGKVGMLANNRWAARLSALRSAGVLARENVTGYKEGLYQSDTGEIVLDSQSKRLTVITPKTEAVVFDVPEAIELGNLKIEQSDEAALVSVSAMDGNSLYDSKRMLLIVATDARNSNMQFSDKNQTTLQNLGTKPVLIKTIRIKLGLSSAYKTQLKVFSTNMRGQRIDQIAVERTQDGVSFYLDTSKLSHGPTTYFEISI